MNLKALIANANKTYGLGLDGSRTDELFNRLKFAGHATEITAGTETTRAIDSILSLSDQIHGDDVSPRAVYASLKQEVVASPDQCPRCKADMRDVKLVGARKALYCQACNITLPTKVE